MIKYEFRKLFHQKIGLFIIMVGIVIAALLFTQTDKIKYYPKQLQRDADIISEYVEAIDGMTYTEALSLLQQEEEVHSKLYLEEWLGHGDNSRMPRKFVLKDYIDKYSYLITYNAYIESVLTQAEQMQKVALFHDSKYVEGNIKQTIKDYSPLKNIELSDDAPQFVAYTTAYKTGDYIIFILIVILVVLVFGYEEGNEGKALLWVQYRGRLPVFLGKMATVMISGTALIIMYLLTILAIGYYHYGGGDFSAALQSLPEFMGCTYLLTVGEYLIAYILLKIISGWLLMMIAIAAVCIAGTIGGMFLSIGSFGAWYIAYQWIGAESLWSPIKYINPVAWFDVYQWISTYRNINFFTIVVPFHIGFSIGFVVLGVVTYVIAVRMYFRNKIWQPPSFIRIMIQRIATLLRKTEESTSLLYHELYRLIIANMQWVLIIIILIIYPAYLGTFTITPKSLQLVSYDYHINSIDKLYTDETEGVLQKANDFLTEKDGYRASLEVKLQSGELTEDEFNNMIIHFEDQKRTRYGLSVVMEQSVYLKKLYEEGKIGVGFFNILTGSDMFMLKRKQILNAFAISGILMVIFVRFLLSDYDVVTLIKASSRGRKDILRVRLWYLAVFAVFLGVLVYIPYYMNILAQYSKQDFGLLIQSIEEFEHFPLDLTIGQVFTISLVLKALGILGITLFMYFLSMWHLKKSVYQVSVMAVIFMPLIMGFVDAPFDYLMFGGMFYGEELLRNNVYMTCVFVGVMLVGMIAFGIISLRKYMGNLGSR